MNGYVKIHRELCEHSLWKDEEFTRGQAWVDLILLANVKEGFVIKRGVRIHLTSGQIGRSMKTLSERWKWSNGRVKRYLELLESEKMIELDITNVSCTITISNFNYWQSNDWRVRRDDESSESTQQTETKRKPNRNQTETKRYTNNKEKEDKEDNKKKRGVGTLTNKDLQKLQYKFPTVNVKDSYIIFTNYYNSRGKEFEDELPAFENWVIQDKENKTHYKTPIEYYENICPKCKNSTSIEITDHPSFVIQCEICGSKKTPTRLSENETEKHLQSRKSRMSETNKGA